jgi:hypothetical protein
MVGCENEKSLPGYLSSNIVLEVNRAYAVVNQSFPLRHVEKCKGSLSRCLQVMPDICIFFFQDGLDIQISILHRCSATLA